MDIYQLKRLIRQGESDKIEFKKKVAHPDKIIREVVAFANSLGGWVLLGVDDSGELSGLKYPDEDQGVLSYTIKKYCRPQIKFSSQIIPINKSRAVVAFEIPASKRKPHYVNSGDISTCYVRVQDKSIKASREMQEILRRQQKTRDMNVQYGDKEQILMEYLSENEYITLSQYQRLANLSKKQTSRTLIHLVLANILDISPEESRDKYFLHSSF